jgi:CO/xanthine dehydrogenase FAD-binding subunit
MKPPVFKYVEAMDEDEIVHTIAEAGDDSRLLAGGQSLVPMMNFRIVAPTVLIDLNRVSPLSYIDCEARSARIGALTRHAMIEDSEVLAQRCPLLVKAVKNVAHRAVRNRGTTGGTLALAYPGAEIPLALMTLGANVNLRSLRGERTVAIKDFIVGALDTVLAADEYIRHVDLFLPPTGSAASFIETSRRHGDFAIGAAAVIAGRDERGKLNYLRAGISGGTGAPIRLPHFEDAVVSNEGIEKEIIEASETAVEVVEVFGDHHYPEGYRRHVLKAMLRRAAIEAVKASEVHHDH